MAFKRYIHRHGKKLGPYYYQNVRSNDGRVKSVYLGTNPGHHPRHRIRKPLFFLILVLVLILILGGSLFLLQNKAYLVGKVRQQDPGFEVDQILLKVLIRSTEFIEKEIRVMNTGSEPAAITIEASGLSDIVSIDSSSFTIKPGQTKTVKLNFSSIIPASSIEQQPGVYVGKLIARSEKGSRDIPMVAEIETKNVLFDMNLNPVALERKVKQGSDTTIEVRLFNLETIESVNVDVEYFVKDINGNTIITESETVVAKTQASFFKTISIPKNLKPGPYIFAAKSRFGNSIGTASYLFEVTGPEQDGSFVQFCKNSILCLGLSFTTILLLFALTAYFYFFIGAYLYEKVTGTSAVQKRKEKEEPEREGFFARLRGNIAAWKQRRLRRKAEEGQLQRKQELLEIEAEEKAEQERGREQLEEERKEMEQKRKEQLERQKSLEQKRALESEKKKRFAGLLHKIGILKTPEEKKHVELLKEKARQQKLREEQEYKRQQELEARKREEEKKKEALEAERRKQEELRRQEELKKQEELEKQKALEDKKQLEEEKNRRAEQEKRQRELEKQRQGRLKAQELEAIKQTEEKLRKNREAAEQLRNELKKAEQEKRSLTSADNDIEARIKRLDHEILEKSRHNEELSLQKNSFFEKYQSQLNELAKRRESQKAEGDAKIKEARARLAEKQNAMMKELEEELAKLSPQKRKSTEKWKRLEIKAKMKIEEQNAEEEIKGYGAGAEENKAIDESYKKSIGELGKKQSELKQAISQLESQKQKVLLEKKNIPRDVESRENELKSLLANLEKNAKEREALSAELSRLKSELSGFSIGFLKKLMTGYKEKAEKARREKEEERARLEAEKRRKEETARKEKGLEEKARKAEDERKKKEEEMAAKEEQKRKALEEKTRLQEEKKRQKAGKKEPGQKPAFDLSGKKPEANEAEEPKEEKKPGIFAKLFGKKEETREEPEEAAFEQPKKSKPKGEAEELEDAIKSLDLFKKIEEGRSIKEKEPMLGGFLKDEAAKEEKKAGEGVFGKLFAKKENQETKIKEKITDKKPFPEKAKKEEKMKKKAIGSKAFGKCRKMLDGAEDAIAKNNMANAKKMYIEARSLYVGLDYREKKEIYGDLMKLYNKLR